MVYAPSTCGFTSTPHQPAASRKKQPFPAASGSKRRNLPFDLWLHVFLRLVRSQHITSGLTAFVLCRMTREGAP